MKKILIIGGSGYLGQHLLSESFKDVSSSSSSSSSSMAFTYHSSSPPQLLLQSFPNAIPFQVDLQTGQGFDSISLNFGQPDVVINCAALSVPRACEADPTIAMSVNVPSSLIKWLSSFTENNNTLLIHLSTDQVYEGTKSYYKEDDETFPVNVYGKSKVAAEEYIIANCSNFAVLRSSIIYGPQTISPVSKSLPIQWMDSVLAKGQETDFFHDEFRCPVYVKDVVNIIQILTNKWISDGKKIQLLLNVGGPNRLSRVQMAEMVARIRGYDTSLIKPVSASLIDRGVKSPADISMDVIVFQKLADEALKQFVRSQGIQSELKNLKKTLTKIQKLLTDASEKENGDKDVKQWLNNLQHLAYDIDDILDGLATDAMLPDLNKETEATTSKADIVFYTSCL